MNELMANMYAQVYLETCQPSMMTIFAKKFLIEAWQSSKYRPM